MIIKTGGRKNCILWNKIFSDQSDVTEAMQVTSTGPQTIQKAQGETVTLGCTYTPGPQDTGELDIEWSNVSPDMTQKDALVGVRLSSEGDLVDSLGCWRKNLSISDMLHSLGLSFTIRLCQWKNLLWRDIITQCNVCISDLIIYRGPDTLLRWPRSLQKAQIHSRPQAGRRFHLSLWCETLRHSHLPV